MMYREKLLDCKYKVLENEVYVIEKWEDFLFL